jgi:GT2 family glycosyltransferase
VTDHADVAVIIPAHRCADAVHTALASVAGQTTRPREVIVADDASGDGTADAARAWAEHLPLTVLSLTVNGGPAAARRAAIAASSAPRLALLDADDVWLPDHLETLAGVHDRHGGIVTADPVRWIPGAGLAPAGVAADLPVPPVADQRATILRHDFVFIGSVFDRALYDAVGGFREQFHGTEDWDLWIRMIRHGAVVRRAPHPTVLYRLSAGSVSADQRLVGEERKVVLAALAETDRDDDRAVLRATLRKIDAKAAMYAAYDAAREGRTWRARRLAVRGLRGPGRIPSRCAALTVAPRWAVRTRDARVNEPRWWLRT